MQVIQKRITIKEARLEKKLFNPKRIKLEDFKFSNYISLGDFLLVNSKDMEKTLNFIKEKNIINLELNFYHGYELKDVSFLNDIKEQIEGISIVDEDVIIDGIENVTNLKYLNINDELTQNINFEVFKYLECCFLLWHKNIQNISSCSTLKELLIKKINLRSVRTLDKLKGLKNLEKLTLIQPKMDDLDFLEFFPNLTELEIYYCSTLKDISALVLNKNKLKKVRLDHCKNILDYSYINKLKELEYLGISDAHEIDSIGFVTGLKKLKHFSFVGTNVLDGDLLVCKDIEYCGFDNKKHYSHRMEDLNQS